MRGCSFCCPSDASDEAEASCASGDGAVDDEEEEDDDDEDANVRPANVHEVAPPHGGSAREEVTDDPSCGPPTNPTGTELRTPPGPPTPPPSPPPSPIKDDEDPIDTDGINTGLKANDDDPNRDTRDTTEEHLTQPPPQPPMSMKEKEEEMERTKDEHEHGNDEHDDGDGANNEGDDEATAPITRGPKAKVTLSKRRGKGYPKTLMGWGPMPWAAS